MINNKLLKEIEEYCKINDIEDVNALIDKMLRQGFTIEKHGTEPLIKNKKIKSKPEPELNKYSINIKNEEEGVIEETVKIKPEINKKSKKDIYGE